MKRILLALPVLPFVLSAAEPLPSALHIDSIGLYRREIYQAANCRITAVRVYDSVINVEFTGQWVPRFSSADTDKNAFTISRDPAISQPAWDFLARRFGAHQGKSATIRVSGGAPVVRGGVPFFQFPAHSFDITSTTTK
jgi:hypothetical protein